MQFWTPERCATISTEILLTELVESGGILARTNNKLYRAKVQRRIEMVRAELARRAA